MIRKTFFISVIIVGLFIACNNKHEQASDYHRSTIVRDKLISPKKNFHVDSITFVHIDKSRRKDDTMQMNVYTEGFTRLVDTQQINFEINFLKDYFKFDKKIAKPLFTSNNYFHALLSGYYDSILNYRANDTEYVSHIAGREFSFRKVNVKNYGVCDIGLIYTAWSNSRQNYCMVLVNNERQELSFWDYDSIIFDRSGNIKTLFRMKAQRTWTYYSFDTTSDVFMPIAEKTFSIED